MMATTFNNKTKNLDSTNDGSKDIGIQLARRTNETNMVVE